MSAGAVAAGRLDFLHDHRRGIELEPAAAEFLGDQRGEKARPGQRIDELGRIGALAVLGAPVFARKFGAQRAHGAADFRQVFAFVHDRA